MTRPQVLSLPPQSHIDLMFRPPVWEALRAEFDVWQNPSPRHLAPEEVLARLPGCSAILTGWGAKQFSVEVLEAAPRLKIVAHAAGSPRLLFADETVRDVVAPRGIVIYSGADGLAANVAEATVGLMILATRRWPLHIQDFRARQTIDAPSSGAMPAGTIVSTPPLDAVFLSGARVGLVSASKVARQVLPHLLAFGCEVMIYDPFLNEETAQALGAQKSSLHEMFACCDIVSLHAPDLAETRGLIGRALLGLLRDGATLVNTSRGPVLDHDALFDECRLGRLFAVLDVTEPEPLPSDSIAWDLPNVLLLPHVAGQGRVGYARIGQGALQALRDALTGRPVVGAVPLDRWETVA